MEDKRIKSALEIAMEKVAKMPDLTPCSGLLNRCFGVPELYSRDAMGCLGVLNRLDNRMR